MSMKIRRVACALHTTNRDEWTLTLDNVPLDSPEALLIAVLPVLRRDVLLSQMRRDSCIASSKLVANLARALGLRVRVQSVRVRVFNTVMTNWLKEHDWEEWTEAEQERLVQLGAKFLEVGYDYHDGPGWSGHLVVVLEKAEGDVLIDPSFDQFHRPKKGIPITEPLVGPWYPHGTASERGDGVSVVYQPRDNDGYSTAPDWKRRYRIVLNGVQADLSGKLKRGGSHE